MTQMTDVTVTDTKTTTDNRKALLSAIGLNKIVQVGDYQTLVSQPSNHFVASFLQDSHVEYVI